MADFASLARVSGAVLGFFGQAISLGGTPSPAAMILAGAVALAMMAVLARMTQLRTRLLPVRIGSARSDYPGPATFRVADDPETSGRPRPRAPSRSFSA